MHHNDLPPRAKRNPRPRSLAAGREVGYNADCWGHFGKRLFEDAQAMAAAEQNRVRGSVLLLALGISVIMPSTVLAEKFRRLPVETYRDKMTAGWVGQMAGVGWGGPTEFRWKGQIIPADQMPAWKPELINQFEQDDLYVEMTFLATLERFGFDVSIRRAGLQCVPEESQCAETIRDVLQWHHEEPSDWPKT